ncbi:MAG: hypothetical protein ACI3W6_09210 [Clostridia bacterium]
MMNLFLKNKNRVLTLCGILLCCALFLCAFSGTAWAASGAQIAAFIDQTYEYEKGGGNKVLSEDEAKKALTADTDLLILAAGRDVGRTAVTDDEFSTYLGYVNEHLKNGNGSYTAADFLRCALAVGAAGGDPSSVGKDAGGNRVDLLYKGLYSRSLASLEKEGIKTVAYGLLALDANGIPDGEMRASGSKVSRSQLRSSLISSAKTLASQGVPDAGTSALVIAALSPDYVKGDAAVVSAVNSLLKKQAGLQSTDGILKDSLPATAEMIIALCAIGVNPEKNEFFAYDLYQGMMRFYCSDGGFSSSVGGSSSASATASARCGLVAYLCYQEDGLFYDFSGVKQHSVKTIASASSSSGSSSSASNKNTSSSSGGTSSSKSSGGNTGSSSSTASAGSSSSASSRSTTGTAAQGTTIAKSVFEGIKGTDESYIYEGTWGEGEPYTLSFKGTDITTPMDFNAAISSVASHQIEIDAAAEAAEYIVFLHAGAFPGKAAATVTVSLADGTYQCYHYDDTAGKFKQISVATVENGMVSFSLDVGGEYFLTSAEINTEGHTFDVGDTINGIVPASVFEDAEGKDVDLTFEGALESGIEYEIVFNGMDITDPVDFDTRISEQSINAGAIGKLAKDPLILGFYHEGSLPGKATVKLYTSLDKDVTYGLYYFNSDEQQGEYCDEVTREEGFLSFEIDHCSDYFITPYNGKAVLTSSAGSRGLMIAALGFELLLVLAAVGAVLHRRFGKDGLKQKLRGTAGFLSLRKKKAAKENKGPSGPERGNTERAFDDRENDDFLPEERKNDEDRDAPEFEEVPLRPGSLDELAGIGESDALEEEASAASPTAVEIDHASFMCPKK